MRTSPPPQLPIFRSDLQAQMLALFLGAGTTEFDVDELRQRLSAPRASVYRELQRLVGAGILERRRVGRNTSYAVDDASPLVEPLRLLVERTLGIEVQLKRLLADVPGVDTAVIFGSFAAGSVRGDSDIDLLVIGDPDRDALERALRDVEAKTGRDVNVTSYGPDEWLDRVRAGSGFASTVLSRPVIPLLGTLPGDAG